MVRKTALTILWLSCAACSVQSGLPLGSASYEAIPAEPADATPRPYLIGPKDVLNITVFREPQLSAERIEVDSGGQIMVPLIGKVQAGGKTAESLSGEIQTAMLQYLKNPRVWVSVTSNSETIAVEGAVNQPGVFPISGKSSLIEALALARSPTTVAAQDQVLVFRKIDGKNAVGRFDIRRIRMGLDPDPMILPGDRVVVGYDGFKEAYINFFAKIPLFTFRVM